MHGPQNFVFLKKYESVSVNLKYKNPIRTLLYKKYLGSKFTYRLVFTNSRFTRQATKELWGLESQVLYPPCSIKSASKINLRRNLAKEIGIVSIGRFVFPLGEAHAKRQDLLIREFKKLRKISSKNFHLYLVGGLGTRRIDRMYFRYLILISRGFNVSIYANASDVLKNEIARKSVFFWHATGFRTTRRQKQEHFGIAIVEAMQFGLIPVVPNRAGPLEILVDFPELLAKRYQDLHRITIRLLDNDLTLLQNKLKERANQFSNSIFYKSFEKMISFLLK